MTQPNRSGRKRAEEITDQTDYDISNRFDWIALGFILLVIIMLFIVLDGVINGAIPLW